MDDANPHDFLPTASLETLQARADLIRQIHGFFHSHDFLHVETPLVSRDTVVDRYIHPISLPQSAFGISENDSSEVFLQTSPEFAMKRLIAAGAPAIYQICKAFRSGESGRKHNPEFTMLEWYRTGDDYQQGMDLLADFAESILERGRPEKMTYQEAFIKHAAIDPFSDSLDRLAATVKAELPGFEISASSDRDELLNVLMAETIEPQIGIEAPCIIYDWPASQAALAKTRENEQGFEVAERFELFVAGHELANGYHELLDAEELQQRNDKVNQQRTDDGSRKLPSESRLLNAMRSGMPRCSGVAVGVDRIVMLKLGKASISQVIAFPFPIA